MANDEKPTIKLSELSDMYNIENDTEDSKNIPEKETASEFEKHTIKQDEIEEELEW